VIFYSFYIVLGQFKNVVSASVDWNFCCAGVGGATVVRRGDKNFDGFTARYGEI
jgi:hypothetical protein